MGNSSKIKPGKIIRISGGASALLESIKPSGASWARFMDGLLDELIGQEFWVLPSSLMNSETRAKTKAIESAAQQNVPFEQREIPVKVKMSPENE